MTSADFQVQTMSHHLAELGKNIRLFSLEITLFFPLSQFLYYVDCLWLYLSIYFIISLLQKASIPTYRPDYDSLGAYFRIKIQDKNILFHR